MNPSTEIRGISSAAVVRAATAMLRTLGGCEIHLLLPAHTLPQESAVELGAVDPGVEDLALGPVIIRTLPTDNAGPRRRAEFLIPASAVASEVTSHNATSAEALLDWALGIVYDGQMYRIEGVVNEQFAGTTYLYRVVACY
jgi:hypothetical protein